ncbi:hypothetical protein PHYBLDRAFT_143006 [Phycomyces blakesleeanus NRRL 1555(-)]|uniref:Mediator of RNA polymerase II transcription subunit 6 n=1 Tax=Phycomyces blakesleeanus (strain ATCC 8743b / DSM 1359 / FGSC 10004 / NBRC 33097 / NRRL 1555) TaxID=763407 RepID=A0A167NIT1_PHYB8|nr:hypothetical protein PHYBLDRAFT_143006 [Phycomyces blakesleeanus NRRL 1555(-)]OAD76019.1 hypothetical protein PHYBLDRAFT_143006 [Phycomyces blakesleeanus NRRL 1555(-)]|eukprot:XP_018294059.1 hypothetical protein PHYBLDRAFT_143006 [Phycomyces blakesleeanus NRRL 1555(-)]
MQRFAATEDLTSVEWRDTNWLERVGGFQNQQMVLDYFAMSPFWDRQCNNQVLSMQTQYNDLRQPYEATVEALRKMTGIEFAVIHEQPPVWVIQKRYRRGPAPDDANVYQSPTIYSVIANRLLTSLFHVNSAFKETQAMMEFHPAKGYSWKANNSTNEKQPVTAIPEKTRGPQPSKLRAQENQAFRHWMDRAIEASAARIAQTRHSLDSQSVEGSSQGSKTATKIEPGSTSAITQQRDDSTGKRQRKKTDDGNSMTNKRKKKAGKQT